MKLREYTTLAPQLKTQARNGVHIKSSSVLGWILLSILLYKKLITIQTFNKKEVGGQLG